MGKVKRTQPLEGNTWDLSLGVVQHTSRWGVIARAKGSRLRYYPGCPWEKPRKPQPEPCLPGCFPPSYDHFVVLHFGYSGPLYGEPYGGALFVGLKPSYGGPIRWTILGQSSSFCPLSIEWSFNGVDGPWLLVYWRAFGDCGEYSSFSALHLQDCPYSPVPTGYYEWPLAFTDPPDTWPGLDTACLYAACGEWFPCGATTGIVTPS